MKIMKKILIIYLPFVLLISSCKFLYYKAPKYIKNNFGYCYSGEKTELNKLLNIYGYFQLNINSGNSSFNENIMFFNDGMFVTGFKYLAEINDNYKNGLTSVFYESTGWGLYKLSGDTIKVRYVKRPFYGSSSRFWYAYEVRYKIIDRNTIKQIYKIPIHKTADGDIEKFKIIGSKKIFIPVKVKPPSDGWIKGEEWFWCNKEQYKKWKQEQKLKHKHKK